MEGNRFPQILRSLLKQRQTTQSALAKAVGRSPQSVTNWCDGSTAPDWGTMIQIADVLDVSIDSLLGRDKSQTPVSDIDTICDYTGLSKDAIQYLHILNSTPHNERLDLLSDLLETGLGRHRAGGSPGFDELLISLSLYVKYANAQNRNPDEVVNSFSEHGMDVNTARTVLEQNGYAIMTAADRAEVLYQRDIIPKLKRILDEMGKR